MGRLVDDWHASRQERTTLIPGERCASIEAELGGSMAPGRLIGWLRLDPHEDREHDREDEEREDGERER